jgi:hypothetical protein
VNSTWMRFGLGSAFLVMLGSPPVRAGKAADPLPGVVLYKSALCGCCGKWADHLRAAGFRVITRNVSSLTTIEARYGVPQGLSSCHTALAGGYLVVGHVPAEVLQRLLRERPAVAGISVPGMPQGAPGMEGARQDRYDVVAFDREGHTRVYARR